MTDLELAAKTRALRLERDRYREALDAVSQVYPRVLELLQVEGVIFDDVGGLDDPENWQHIAFTVSAHLCEVDDLARNALDASRREA